MGARTKRETRPGNPLSPRAPSKYAQGQVISRDGPPLGDMVASTVIFRFSPKWTLEIIGVEDHDPRKSVKRFVDGVHSPFCLCLPGGRQQTNMKSGTKETPHEVARDEAWEEADISLSLNELSPVLTARRVGWGSSGRDQFDKERPSDGQVIHFDHFVFACYGENILPGTPREKNIKNPAWHPIESVLDNPLWSFDHVTLIVATLQILGDLFLRWINGEWTPETSRGMGAKESLGALFFERFAVPLQKSPEALATITKFARTNLPSSLLQSVSRRQRRWDTHVHTRDTNEEAERYLGLRKKEKIQIVEQEKLEAMILRLEGQRERQIERRKDPVALVGKETQKEQDALADTEKKLKRTKAQLRWGMRENHGKFVADSFRSLAEKGVYEEVLREIANEQASRSWMR
ncbi:MAG: hypothetical protein A3D67_00695 [Candidatus Lloydbacteria bacterium RIFCSPHIGHO2_02_FULL_51_22]|uniref:Nudix hydrolase domain-containing protein n=3 Tax=Candidatus Lloydiibacteriota TaxID=1817910 RepID=A0A1G2DHH0_9BACT|nr:MAG: hypothetical protein A3D67_00695 [Candidatus Lloydbacteria bacterium RIFCSPHIGHO2_02_FULL_51_22]OGZ15881.1 MAG: hypothetical protein A3J08_04560 [Candidatus Lloydbacteria bacterium RIFCSPLOWO2_02_FULL_51_11]OGZ16246.1 MAG: hypothetical protein A3G11_00105 [Candidatus Lloydbacteria bacterium RIFCSPLOWO2_12_FULL_51_9]